MVFGYRLRGLLSPLLNGGDIGYFLDAVSRDATEVCEEFYDTLSFDSLSPYTLFRQNKSIEVRGWFRIQYYRA
jgi:hypothetical protein